MPGEEPAEGAAPVAVGGDDGVHVPAGLLQLRHRHRVQVVQDQALAVEVSMTFRETLFGEAFPWTFSLMKTPIRLLVLSLFDLKNLCQMGEST